MTHTIPAVRPQKESLNFEFLLETGIKHLERLTGKKWTDFNTHDPGITILEVLCFAITELGLKINQPIGDLIASSRGPADSLLGLTKLLSSEPVTTTDYRKILVDLPEVKNVWLTPWKAKGEVSYYFSDAASSLNYTGGELIKPKGLWEVLLEFTEDALNTNVISRQLGSIDDREYVADLVFPYWDQLESQSVGDTVLSITAHDLVEIPGESPGTLMRPNGTDEYLSILRIDYDTGISEEFPIYIKILPSILPAHVPVFADQNPATNPVLQLLDSSAGGSVLDDFNTKNNTSRMQVANLQQYLAARRNLCEDFAFFKTVRTQEIAVRADFELLPGSDVVDTLAEILFQIDQFMSPIINYSDFDAMLEEKQFVSKVYEGPLLNNGFISGCEFEGFERNDTADGQQVIFHSDIIRLIKNLNGTPHLREDSYIVDVKNLKLSNFINNILVTEATRNCLKLTQSNLYKPKLSPTKSVLQVFQYGIAVEVEFTDILDRFREKLNEALSGSSTYPVDILPVPTGQGLEVSVYNTIQFDFPMLYKLKPGQLGPTDKPKVQGKVKQLKAYLAFYDQLLMNNTAQLSNLNEIFAVNPTNERTYFYEALDQIPGFDELLSGSYSGNLPDIVEAHTSQLRRRNLFLDHLLARYCEDPADFQALRAFYLNLVPDFNSQPPANKQIILAQISERIIAAKRTFLEEYIEISSGRAQGYNYMLLDSGSNPDVWDSTNVSGVEQRVARLLGIKNYNQRSLSSINTGTAGEGEGFHLLEHILLRPESNGLGDIPTADSLLNAEVEYDIYKDPYSFITTLIFPSGFERDFTDPNTELAPVVECERFRFRNFRVHAEQLLRRELPAHVLLHVFWLHRNTGGTNPTDTLTLNEFESVFQIWLETRADPNSSATERINAREGLIEVLNQLLKPHN